MKEDLRALGRQGIDESPPGIRDMEPVHALLRQRSTEYGGFDNLSCAGDLEETYRRWASRAVGTGTRKKSSTAHEHCIMMALAKIARIATGQYNPDNYLDLQGYVELAHQLRQQEER